MLRFQCRDRSADALHPGALEIKLSKFRIVRELTAAEIEQHDTKRHLSRARYPSVSG